MSQVRKERTGWRDEKMSLRHREWGWDCPAIDIDFLMIEYDLGKAIAVIEYKNEHAKKQTSSHPSYKALKDLSDKAKLPFFAVRYADDFSWWLVVPLNSYALSMQKQRKKMTEKEYVSFLYVLRGKIIPDKILSILKG